MQTSAWVHLYKVQNKHNSFIVGNSAQQLSLRGSDGKRKWSISEEPMIFFLSLDGVYMRLRILWKFSKLPDLTDTTMNLSSWIDEILCKLLRVALWSFHLAENKDEQSICLLMSLKLLRYPLTSKGTIFLRKYEPSPQSWFCGPLLARTAVFSN